MALKSGLAPGIRTDKDVILQTIADFSNLNAAKVQEKADSLLSFVKNFDTTYPNLKNLQVVCPDEVKLIKASF